MSDFIPVLDYEILHHVDSPTIQCYHTIWRGEWMPDTSRRYVGVAQPVYYNHRTRTVSSVASKDYQLHGYLLAEATLYRFQGGEWLPDEDERYVVLITKQNFDARAPVFYQGI